ncbi:AMP-binding protein [Kibdelosporangium philippinense]|uniref:AMP-binding protein n=1 Tax=Kibdelosporangium philippinense TaxID=211113 RepID=A0ABS8ZBA0_9PSEU|nr:AMP-binding protein [Kibdelosporangium philippinense]MCE7003813.1 AMP-binding protein [Kibdelosporangium philippinense]
MAADLLVDVLNAARAHRSCPAITDRRTTITYGQLLASVLGTAQRLRDNGFQAGSRMLFSIRPGVRAVVLALGTVAAGGTVVPFQPDGDPEMFESRLDLVKPTWAAAESIVYATGVPGVRSFARRPGIPSYRKLDVRHIRSGPWLPGVPRGALSAAKLAEPVRFNEFPACSPNQAAVVTFATGTTVEHTRGALGTVLRTLARRGSLGTGDQVRTEHLRLGLPALLTGAQWTIGATER